MTRNAVLVYAVGLADDNAAVFAKHPFGRADRHPVRRSMDRRLSGQTSGLHACEGGIAAQPDPKREHAGDEADHRTDTGRRIGIFDQPVSIGNRVRETAEARELAHPRDADHADRAQQDTMAGGFDRHRATRGEQKDDPDGRGGHIGQGDADPPKRLLRLGRIAEPRQPGFRAGEP